MNAFKTTSSLAVIAAVFALAGCDQRDDAVVTPAPDAAGGTASAPGMTGESGSMAPGGTATTPPPMDSTTPPAMAPGASAPASRP